MSSATTFDETDALLLEVGLTKKKRRGSLYVLGLFYFLSGVEYAVILPTIWLYLRDLEEHRQWFLGLVISFFSVASMFSSPLYGLFADSGGIKRLVLVSSSFMVLGNFLYFAAQDAYCILESRFLCGWGSGAAAASFAYLARVTTKGERTQIIGTIIACRQLGVLLGPGLNFGLERLHVDMGPLVLDSLSAPGFFMAILWVLCGILGFFMFHDIKLEGNAHLTIDESASVKPLLAYDSYDSSVLEEADRILNGDNDGAVQPTHGGRSRRKRKRRIPKGVALVINYNQAYTGPNGGEASGHVQGEGMVSVSEEGPSTRKEDGYGAGSSEKRRSSTSSTPLLQRAHSSFRGESSSAPSEPAHPPLSKWGEYLQLHVLVLFMVQFLCIFNQVALETWVTPFTDHYFRWQEKENSIMYICVGATAILAFACVQIMSICKISDRFIMLVGLFAEAIGLIVATGMMPFLDEKDTTFALTAFILSCFFIVFGLPFLFVPSPSLVSKLTSEQYQGFGQGLRRTLVSLATIVGPLWAGSMSQHVTVFVGFMLGLVFVAMTSYLAVIKRLAVDATSESAAPSQQPSRPTSARSSRQEVPA
eukprot:m.33092 g.33092  ORF g.33092 m.33092 type:complete len:590 (-) comp9573_c0_seq4:297-2066(-)